MTSKVDYESDDILVIARHLSEQGFYYSPQWEQAADEIERLREALRSLERAVNDFDAGECQLCEVLYLIRAALEGKE